MKAYVFTAEMFDLLHSFCVVCSGIGQLQSVHTFLVVCVYQHVVLLAKRNSSLSGTTGLARVGQVDSACL